jgi:tetratricopeptide (TPR) repeat protein
MKENTLHQLVRSMSATEKRYFKLYSSKYQKDKNYQDLFEIVNSLEKYDENVVLRKLNKKISPSKFQFEKNYLYNVILKSLNEFHAEISIESKIDEINKNIEILEKKGLYQQAFKLINKAVKLAEKYQCFSPLVRTYALEQDIYEKLQKHDAIFASIEKSKQLFKTLSVIENYRELSVQVSYKNTLYRTTQNEKHLKDIESSIGSRIKGVDIEELPYHAKMNVNFSKARYHGLRGEVELSMKYFKEMLDLFEEYPAIIQLDPEDYLIAFGNYAMCMIDLKRYDELLKNIQNLRALKDNLGVKNSDYHQAYFFFFTNLYELSIYNKIGRLSEAIQVAQNFEDHIEAHQKFMPKTVIFNTYKELSMSYFLKKDYHLALKYINLIMQDELSKYSWGHIYYIIVHFELGNEIIISSLINSSKRLLKNQGRLLPVDELVLSLLKELLKSKKPKKDICQKYLKKMKSIKIDASTKTSIDYFDVITWVKSKVQSIPLHELLMDKFKSPK